MEIVSPYVCTLSTTGGLLCTAIFWLQKMRMRFVVSQKTTWNASLLPTLSEVRASMKLVSHLYLDGKELRILRVKMLVPLETIIVETEPRMSSISTSYVMTLSPHIDKY